MKHIFRASFPLKLSQADARVLRTVLALVGENDRLLRHGSLGFSGHIVAGAHPPNLCLQVVSQPVRQTDRQSVLRVSAELADIDNEPLVKLAGGEDLCTVTSHDIIGRYYP